jgi:hypothetical protein
VESKKYDEEKAYQQFTGVKAVVKEAHKIWQQIDTTSLENINAEFAHKRE